MPTPSAVRAFFALVWFSVRRQGRVRQMGLVALALLGVTALVVAVITHGPVGWRMEDRKRAVMNLRPRQPADRREAFDVVLGGAGAEGYEQARQDPDGVRWITHRDYARERLTMFQGFGPPDEFGVKAAVFAAYRATLEDEAFARDYAFLNYSRWVVFSLYLSFLLPLLTLAYASGAIGAEREGRTLLWLFTRPLPRWAVYLAKLLGGLPWCVGVCGAGFGLLCLAGGEWGRKAAEAFWPAVLAGAVAFGCVFHMVGAVFRWPTVVGLVYVFFFEILVANLPGGLKQFSLNYYLKSLFYNRLGTAAPTVRMESLASYQPAEPATCWIVLMVVAVGVTVLGAWLFGRQEPKDET